MTSHLLNELIIFPDDYHNKEYHMTEDMEQVLFKSEQLDGIKPKQLEWDVQMITKRQKFNFWEEMYEELDGNPNTLEHLKTCFEKNVSKSNYDVLCVPIIHAIKKLPRGKEKVFEYYIEYDRMECTHLKVATIFNNITQGSYIRKQTKPDSKGNMKVLIYKYNDETQLWDNTIDLKTHFIDTMKTYCALLCQKNGSVAAHDS